MKPVDLSFTRETWRHWLAHIRAFALAPDAGGRARALFAVVVLLALSLNGFNVVNSYVGRNFMTAIAERDRLGFVAHAIYWVAVFAVLTVLSVLARFYEDRLGLHWRHWATRQLLARYMNSRHYLQVAARGDIENPDQRIAEDVRFFTTFTLSFALMVFNGTLTVIAFAAVLWSISPTLFVVGVLYAGAGTLLSLVLGRPLVRLNYQQLDREADFRAGLVHVKEHAQVLALAHREPLFARRLGQRLGALIANAGRMIEVQRNLNFFTTGYNWLIQLIPALCVAPLFMRGDVEFGAITQSAMAFTHLLGAFSLIVTQIQNVSSLAAVVTRLDTLQSAVEIGTPAPVIDSPPRAAIVVREDDSRICFDHVTVLSAHRRRVLVDALDFELHPGQRLLVRGAENDVRTVLVRTLAGLRDHGSGVITRPSGDALMFVTEQPYVPLGTLLDMLYDDAMADATPESAREARRTEVLDLLHALGIEAVLARCVDVNTEQNWSSLLTLGEQQLLACARVLLARPAFVVLERLSVTLERAQIARLLGMLEERGITYLLFEPAWDDLAPFDRMLELTGQGHWQLHELHAAARQGTA